MITITSTIPNWVHYIGIGIWWMIGIVTILFVGGIAILTIADWWWYFNQCPWCGRRRAPPYKERIG